MENLIGINKEKIIEILQKMLDNKDITKDGVVDLLENFNIEVRVCSECGKIMTEGYVLQGGFAYYCSDECLNKNFTDKEWRELYSDDGENYYTKW